MMLRSCNHNARCLHVRRLCLCGKLFPNTAKQELKLKAGCAFDIQLGLICEGRAFVPVFTSGQTHDAPYKFDQKHWLVAFVSRPCLGKQTLPIHVKNDCAIRRMQAKKARQCPPRLIRMQTLFGNPQQCDCWHKPQMPSKSHAY